MIKVQTIMLLCLVRSRYNLLSVMKLLDRGLKIDFINHKVKICQKNSGEVIAVEEQIDDHFIIDMVPTKKNNNSNNVCISSKKGNNAADDKFNGNIEDVWHRRLGHVNSKYMQRLIKENLYIGINNNKLNNNKLEEINCKACKTCKLSRKPHKSVIYEQSSEVLELLHGYLWVHAC